MKKLFLIAAALLTVGFAHAQMSTSVGYVNTIIHDWDETFHINGFNVEFNYDYNLAGDFYVSAGAGFGMSLYQETFNDSVFNVRVCDFSIPVDLNYRFNLGSNLKLNIYAGPTFMIGLCHTFYYDGKKDVDYYSNSNYPLKRFNVLLGGGVSLDIKDHYRIKVGYKKGLLELDKTGEYPYKKDYLTASIGYIF